MITSFEGVLDPDDLDRPPSRDDIPADPPGLDALGWACTILGGAALAAAGAGLALLLSARSGRDVSVSVILIVVGAALVKVLPRVAGVFDVRVVTAVAAGLLAVLAVVPPAHASDVGGRVAIAAVAFVFGLLSVRLWRHISTANAEAQAWNVAYRDLAASPQLATRTRVRLEESPLGRGHTLQGDITFEDLHGVEHVAPLSTMKVMRVVLADPHRVAEPLRYAVWHDVGCSIVLTRVLLAGAAPIDRHSV